MKKITRLAALLMVLLMLCNLTVSATESTGGIPLEDLDMAAWSMMLNNAKTANQCDGEDCGYNAFIAMSGFERYEKLVEWVNTTLDDSVTTMYNEFLQEVSQNHKESEAICLCFISQYDVVNYPYGGLNHQANVPRYDGVLLDYCPWHFSQLTEKDKYEAFKRMSVEDQYEVIKDMTDEERAEYTVNTLSQAQYNALMEYIEKMENASSNVCVVEGNVLMYDGEPLATITDNGYIVDNATGIVVGRYDFESGEFTMGTSSN